MEARHIARWSSASSESSTELITNLSRVPRRPPRQPSLTTWGMTASGSADQLFELSVEGARVIALKVGTIGVPGLVLGRSAALVAMFLVLLHESGCMLGDHILDDKVIISEVRSL